MLDTIRVFKDGTNLIRVINMGECGPHRSHKHNYDHTTLVIFGSAEIIRHTDEGDENLGVFHQGCATFIRKGTEHTLKPLVPNTMYACIYPHRDFDGHVAEIYLGNPEAYR